MDGEIVGLLQQNIKVVRTTEEVEMIFLLDRTRSLDGVDRENPHPHSPGSFCQFARAPSKPYQAERLSLQFLVHGVVVRSGANIAATLIQVLCQAKHQEESMFGEGDSTEDAGRVRNRSEEQTSEL